MLLTFFVSLTNFSPDGAANIFAGVIFGNADLGSCQLAF
jgi:hypothetical protein